MNERVVNQTGAQPIYIERNEGKIYVGNRYTEDPGCGFPQWIIRAARLYSNY